MDAVEEIKSRLSIEELVGRYVDLKRSGGSYKGLCPFHQEKTPSFYVTPARGSFHCFGCDKGGDVFSFLMEIEHLAFPEALSRLADQAGVRLPDRESNRPSLKGRLHEVNESAARFFRDALGAGSGGRARQYLTGRGFGREAEDLFELGYAPEGRDPLVQHLRRAGVEDRILLAAGLALQDDIGGALRDRFHGRLMFPIRDSSGRIAGFGGRTLGDSQPKYLNSPQTEIFDKSAVLYGVHLAAGAMRKEGKGVLVEGYLDALRAHVAGFSWTVASLGTAVTVAQLTILSRLTDTVILALDPDPAGQSAAARAALTALAQVTQTKGRAPGEPGALDLRIATLPEEGGDPDELIRDHPERWQQIMDASLPAFEFFFRQTMASLDRSSETWRQEAIDWLLPHIQQFAGSAGWQATWLERLARETDIDPRALQRSIPAAGTTRRRQSTPRRDRGQEVASGTTTRALTSDPRIAVEEALLALLLRIVVLPADAITQLESIRLERPEHRSLVDALLPWAATGNYDYQMLRETIPEDLRELADELYGREAPLPDDGKISVAVAFHLARLRQFRLQAQLERAGQTLVDVDDEGKPLAIAAMRDLMSALLETEHTLDGLSKQMLQASTGGSR